MRDRELFIFLVVNTSMAYVLLWPFASIVNNTVLRYRSHGIPSSFRLVTIDIDFCFKGGKY